MSAKFNPLPRKEFEIELTDGTVIKGQFGTWALKRFCDKLNLTLTEAQEKLQGLSGFIDYILCAVEYTARKEKAPFSYTDMDAADWIDQLGGITSENFTRIAAHTADENATEEKKTGNEAT